MNCVAGIPLVIHHQMLATLQAAVSEGTQANRERYKSTYLHFCDLYKVPAMTPSSYQLCIYLQYLFNSMKAVGSMLNYFSGARTFIDLNFGDTSVFATRAVAEMKKGMVSLSKHVPSQAPPLHPDQVIAICAYFDTQGIEGHIHKTALLIMYHTFLRQSNVTSTVSDDMSPHMMCRGDVTQSDSGLHIRVRSSKTIRKLSQQVTLPVHRLPSSRPHCAVLAYLIMIRACPAPPGAPAFVMPSGAPLTSRQLLSALRRALKATGTINSTEYTLHSARRGAAQLVAAQGVDVCDVKLHGTWTSSAVYQYTPKVMYTSVPTALTNVFGLG